MTDAAIHRVLGDAKGLSVHLLRASGSPRAYSPRDDKSGIFTMKGVEVVEFLHCHCEERAERETRQSIVSRRTRAGCLFVYWFTVDRHGLCPRDDKGELRDSTVRLLRTSGSPRAMPSR